MQQGGFGAALNNAPLVLGDRAEGAAPKAAPQNIDRMLNHLHRRNQCVTIAGVGEPPIEQVEYPVQLIGFQRDRRRVQPYLAVAVGLNERQRIVGVGFFVKYLGRVSVELRVVGDGLG